MSRRRNDEAASRAADAASEAARVMQQRQQEVRAEKAQVETKNEPANERVDTPADPERMEKLRQNRPHTRALEEIAASREPKEEPAVEEPKADPVKEEPKVEAEPSAVAEAPGQEAAAPETVKIKVDGEEFDVPKAEVESAGGVSAYQRERAADNRLNKAKAALEEARKTQAQIGEWLMRQQQAPQAGKSEKDDTERLFKLVDQERFGTPEESIAAKREITKILNPSQPVDQQAIIDSAINRIRNEQAVTSFKREFADVWGNPLLQKLARTIDAERIPLAVKEASGGPVDWEQHYRKIGNELRPLLGRQSQPATAPQQAAGNPSQAPDKEARKASIVNLPTAAARAEMPKEEKELTPEEARKQAIADMRKSRGLSG